MAEHLTGKGEILLTAEEAGTSFLEFIENILLIYNKK